VKGRLAAVLAAEWRRQGWEHVTLRRYDVLHSSPRSVTLEMTAPVRVTASLREDAYARDPDTGSPRIDGAYFGYSASGDVTAGLVYAHSGNPEDYELLRKNGISVKGKVVIVRYSNPYSYRGFKALTAEREGAAALLIYSDPADDGYAQGKVFPDGPWGPETHIQHGAITYDFIVPGVSERITSRFQKTHDIQRIDETSRSRQDYPFKSLYRGRGKTPVNKPVLKLVLVCRPEPPDNGARQG